ncbi:hypothetical protein N0V82_010234 [Gnomoniopsis sp. IMI 355080]|nr:hypothetical protein N0V82_010234 [Gnomoniopsis sp. IMI 355080]
MVWLPSVAWAISLLTIVRLVDGQAPTPARRDYQGDLQAQAMMDGSQTVKLNQGWPWEGGYNVEAACATDLPAGAGPVTSPDTAAAFQANTVYSTNANTYGVTNSTYTVVTINSNGSVFPTTSDPKPIGYLGWMNMPSYTPYSCAQLCTSMTPTCNSYNIYYLRSPTVAPGAACPTPASM